MSAWIAVVVAWIAAGISGYFAFMSRHYKDKAEEYLAQVLRAAPDAQPREDS